MQLLNYFTYTLVIYYSFILTQLPTVMFPKGLGLVILLQKLIHHAHTHTHTCISLLDFCRDSGEYE